MLDRFEPKHRKMKHQKKLRFDQIHLKEKEDKEIKKNFRDFIVSKSDFVCLYMHSEGTYTNYIYIYFILHLYVYFVSRNKSIRLEFVLYG